MYFQVLNIDVCIKMALEHVKFSFTYSQYYKIKLFLYMLIVCFLLLFFVLDMSLSGLLSDKEHHRMPSTLFSQDQVGPRNIVPIHVVQTFIIGTHSNR